MVLTTSNILLLDALLAGNLSNKAGFAFLHHLFLLRIIFSVISIFLVLYEIGNCLQMNFAL